MVYQSVIHMMLSKDSIKIIFLWIIGSVCLQVSVGFQIADRFIQGHVSQVVTPIKEATQQLENLLHEVELKKIEINHNKEDALLKVSNSPKQCLTQDLIHQSTILKSWDFDSCVNFTDDAKAASEIVSEGSILTKNISDATVTYTKNILNCPTFNVQTTVTCYHDNVKALRDSMANFKNASLPIVKNGTEVAHQMRVDFDKCIGIPVTTITTIDQHLKHCS